MLTSTVVQNSSYVLNKSEIRLCVCVSLCCVYTKLCCICMSVHVCDTECTFIVARSSDLSKMYRFVNHSYMMNALVNEMRVGEHSLLISIF